MSILYPVLGALALAAGLTTAGEPPQRIRSVALADGRACPKPAPDEVVVCHPIEAPYRIPKSLRRSEIAARTQSWVNRAATLDEIGRVAGGLPDTCSVVGTGGQTGCTAIMLRQWAAERREMRRKTGGE